MSARAEDDDGRVRDHGFRAPAPALRQLVGWYAGYRDAGVAPAVHRGLPSPGLTVIFTLDDKLTIAAHPDPAQPAGSFETLVGGLHTRPALITHEGSQSGIQLALSPLGARALLGLPASEVAGIDVHGHEVLGSFAARVQDRLRAAATWDERFAVLDSALLCRLQATGERARPSAEVCFAWRRLLQSRGTVPVAELAAAIGWSDRHLRARFQAETGLSPKAAARVIRFDRARRMLQRRAAAGEPLRLADLAACCGYFDQAHLDREFGRLAGCPPTTWLAQEFRNVQVSPREPMPG
jgi:AraC-like DNA-binding protein